MDSVSIYRAGKHFSLVFISTCWWIMTSPGGTCPERYSRGKKNWDLSYTCEIWIDVKMRGSVLIHLAWSNGNSSVSYSFHFSSLSELRTWKDKLGVKLSHLYSFRPWRTLGSSLTLQTLKHRWLYDWMKLMNEWMDRESGKRDAVVPLDQVVRLGPALQCPQETPCKFRRERILL